MSLIVIFLMVIFISVHRWVVAIRRLPPSLITISVQQTIIFIIAVIIRSYTSSSWSWHLHGNIITWGYQSYCRTNKCIITKTISNNTVKRIKEAIISNVVCDSIINPNPIYPSSLDLWTHNSHIPEPNQSISINDNGHNVKVKGIKQVKIGGSNLQQHHLIIHTTWQLSPQAQGTEKNMVHFK